ncbi:PTS sugar transporter subunit IIA [Caloranaerobacter azorensis]|uniref:Ascorbate-specific PTS system EIIA component n=1 Tax=Caloranaerobacter azorensis TaxID=116090 RepID=A0A6P1YE20_9FIRM|nr:PTS sugar transporter subunit IIA [Caloranaerobacter azorensis]QIB27609.1 PTS sugar transporter subunit IIA [Caloranaerobacter azorensis]
MVKEIIKKENIKLKVYAENWQEAIEEAGKLLLNSNYISYGYITSMIDTVKKLGPYIVIVPNIAIAHARPSESVLKEGISMITLKNPVEFGNKDNDPVDIVFAFGAKSPNEHLAELTKLVRILENQSIIDEIRKSNDIDFVYGVINSLAI